MLDFTLRNKHVTPFKKRLEGSPTKHAMIPWWQQHFCNLEAHSSCYNGSQNKVMIFSGSEKLIAAKPRVVINRVEPTILENHLRWSLHLINVNRHQTGRAKSKLGTRHLTIDCLRTTVLSGGFLFCWKKVVFILTTRQKATWRSSVSTFLAVPVHNQTKTRSKLRCICTSEVKI